MNFVQSIQHHREVVARLQQQVAHYRNLADKAETLIVQLAESMANPNPTNQIALTKAQIDYTKARNNK